MAKGPKYEFKIPEPRGLEARPKCTKIKERPLIDWRPTDAHQLAPTPEYPVPQRYRMGGGC